MSTAIFDAACMAKLGLVENGIITTHSEPDEYYQFRFTSGLWWNKWRPMTYFFIVDEFGFK